MKKLLVLLLATLMLVVVVAAPMPSVQCSDPAVRVVSNPEQTIVVCDDPEDSTCEQDFESLCPVNYHLCNYTEYNDGNDNWVGESDGVPMLGEIRCRGNDIDSGAGHFSVPPRHDLSVLFSEDRVNNWWAGSSISGVCESNYGCNEKQFYALCCVDSEIDDVPNDNLVPEFGVFGAFLVLLGAGLVIFRKKK